MAKKELTEAQKKALQMKLEVAEELGLLEKVQKVGWKGLTSRESGRIGGVVRSRNQAKKKAAGIDQTKESKEI